MLKILLQSLIPIFYCTSPDSCQYSVFMCQLKIAGIFQLLPSYIACVRNLSTAVQTVLHIGHTQQYICDRDLLFRLILSVSFTNFLVFVGNVWPAVVSLYRAPSTAQHSVTVPVHQVPHSSPTDRHNLTTDPPTALFSSCSLALHLLYSLSLYQCTKYRTAHQLTATN